MRLCSPAIRLDDRFRKLYLVADSCTRLAQLWPVDLDTFFPDRDAGFQPRRSLPGLLSPSDSVVCTWRANPALPDAAAAIVKREPDTAEQPQKVLRGWPIQTSRHPHLPPLPEDRHLSRGLPYGPHLFLRSLRPFAGLGPVAPPAP